MINVIAVTSMTEQKEVMRYLLSKLKNEYLTDSSVSVIQSGITKIEIYHEVNDCKVLAMKFCVVMVPISISLEPLAGFPSSTNFNINRVIEKLDKMKIQAISQINQNRTSVRKTDKALHAAVQQLFQ
jgi:hypothetical protein